METSNRVVPPQWTVTDRRLFIEIAERKKREHCSCYALVGIGGQLFLQVNKNRQTHLLKNAIVPSCQGESGQSQGDAVEEDQA